MTYYYGNSGVIGFRYNNTDYYYRKNLQGDIIAIYTESGTLVAEYLYDAWGKVLQVSNKTSAKIGNINPFRYRGYYYDTETGLYYLETRYYDPVIGRFINTDSLEYLGDGAELSNYNLFAYCGDNPVMGYDPRGTAFETFFDVVSLVGSVAEVISTPTNVWAWAGLIGDVADLIPFVTGIGETVDIVRLGARLDDAVDVVDDVVDAAQALRKASSQGSDLRKAVGSYEIVYKSGKNYVGKGGFQRAIQSARQHALPNELNGNLGDTVVSICWKKAPDNKTAFIDEYIMQCKNKVNNPNTYNKIWSPGKRCFFGD